jgi:hypothetical protein
VIGRNDPNAKPLAPGKIKIGHGVTARLAESAAGAPV